MEVLVRFRIFRLCSDQCCQYSQLLNSLRQTSPSGISPVVGSICLSIGHTHTDMLNSISWLRFRRFRVWSAVYSHLLVRYIFTCSILEVFVRFRFFRLCSDRCCPYTGCSITSDTGVFINNSMNNHSIFNLFSKHFSLEYADQYSINS